MAYLRSNSKSAFLVKLRQIRRNLIVSILLCISINYFMTLKRSKNLLGLTDNLAVFPVYPALHSSSPLKIESTGNLEFPSFVSYCSSKADSRGAHQNVIAFSFYGDFSNSTFVIRYLEPLKMSLQNISQAYPSILT